MENIPHWHIMLTHFNSPPVTKPTTPFTSQDNQSMKSSQTTQEYTHKHSYTRALSLHGAESDCPSECEVVFFHKVLQN